MSKETVDNARETLTVIQGGVEELGELLDYAHRMAGQWEEDSSTIEALRRIRGIRYGLDKLENELLS